MNNLHFVASCTIMILITYHAEPGKDSAEYGTCIGAYINCYLNTNNIYQALEISERKIKEVQWENITFDFAETIDEDDVPEETREYVDQAKADGEVYLFNMYKDED